VFKVIARKEDDTDYYNWFNLIFNKDININVV